MKPSLQWFAGAAIALILLGGVTPAAAQDYSGAVLRVRGRGASAARTAIIQAAEQRLVLASRQDVEAAASELGVDLGTPEGRQAVAQHLGLHVLIDGRVSGRGRRARTTIRVYGTDGNEVASESAGRPTGRAGRNRIRRATDTALDVALAAVAAEMEAAAQRRREEEAAERARMQAEIAQDQAELHGDEEEDDASGGGGLPLVRILAGWQGRKRSAEINLASGGASTYDSGFYTELGLRLESFPLGNSASAIRGLYLDVDFRISLGLSSQEVDGTGAPVGNELTTTTWRLLANAGYQYPIGGGCEGEGEDEVCAPPTALVGALVGYGLDSFSIDDNTTMSSANYSFLRLGLTASVTLAGEMLAVRGDFGYRLTFGAGDLATEFGEDASVSGLDFGLGLGGKHTSGLSYLVRFGYSRYGLDFSGNATREPAVDGSDSAIEIFAGLGYSL